MNRTSVGPSLIDITNQIKPGDLVQLKPEVRPYGWDKLPLVPEEITDLSIEYFWLPISVLMYTQEITQDLNLKRIDNPNKESSVQAVLFEDRAFYILCDKQDLEKI